MTNYAPIAQWAESYTRRGFSVLPLLKTGLPGFAGKPLMRWTDYCKQTATEDEIAMWCHLDEGAGLALACGFNGIVGIDVDAVCAFPATREVFGHLKPPSKVGSKGATGFFLDPMHFIQSKVFRAKKNPDGTPGEVMVEVLAGGRCTTIPPTRHRKTGEPYKWRTASLEDYRVTDLPWITQGMVDELARLLTPLMDPPPTPKPIAIRIEPAKLVDLDRRRYAGVGRRVLEAEIAKNASCAKGARGRQLYNSICALGKYIHSGILDANEVSIKLTEATKHNRLFLDNGSMDIARTIQAGLAASANDALPALRERPRAA